MGTLRRARDGKEAFLFAEHVIGRMPSCTLTLDASFVSIAHALVRWNGERWELRDLGSTNGTYVNGTRLAPGQSVLLEEGSSLMFGNRRESWLLAEAAAPAPAAVPLEGGSPSFFSAGSLAVPSPFEPLVTIYSEQDGWWLESDDGKARLAPGQHFQVAGRTWRFECAPSAPVTVASQRSIGFDEMQLSFVVSRDEEHVSLSLHGGAEEHALGERTCFYLALILARQRLAEQGHSPDDAGWIDVDAFLKMVPEYAVGSALNVEIYRLRRALGDAGLRDAARIVQRRRGQLRLGTERFVIRGPVEEGE